MEKVVLLSLLIMVSGFAEIESKIIPFFKKYPLQGKKRKSFEAFCKVAKLIKAGKHLDKEGVEKAKKIRESVSGKKRIIV